MNRWKRRTFCKRSRKDRWLGGICGALGARTPAPSWAWRLLFVLLFMIYGTGFLLYVLLWIFVPQEPEDEVTK